MYHYTEPMKINVYLFIYLFIYLGAYLLYVSTGTACTVPRVPVDINPPYWKFCIQESPVFTSVVAPLLATVR